MLEVVRGTMPHRAETESIILNSIDGARPPRPMGLCACMVLFTSLLYTWM